MDKSSINSWRVKLFYYKIADVSFILTRDFLADYKSPNKLRIYTIVLVMF